MRRSARIHSNSELGAARAGPAAARLHLQVLEVSHQGSLGRSDGTLEELISTDRAFKLSSTAGAKSGKRKKATRKKTWVGTNRGVRADILSNPRSVADLTVERVLVNAVGRSRLADVAGTAGEHELAGNAVFLGVEQVGARFGCQ